MSCCRCRDVEVQFRYSCHIVRQFGNKTAKVWYSSPTNRHKYIRAFKDAALPSQANPPPPNTVENKLCCLSRRTNSVKLESRTIRLLP